MAPIARMPRLFRQMAAVMTREICSRYTGDALGYGWAYITPLAWIGLIYVVFALMGRVAPIDTDIGSFIMSGVLPYLAFRFQVTAAIRAKTAWRYIATLPDLTMGTVHLAIFLLELCNALLIYLVLLGVNCLLGGALDIDRPLLWLLGFVLASGAGGALGYAVASTAQRADSASRIMAVALRPLFYITPIFYVTAELPEDAVWLLSWNPLLHAIEILRSGAFLSYQTQVGSAWMPLAFIVACVVIGRYGETRVFDGPDGSPVVLD